MRIEIKTIPHSSQRYPTVGDWTFSPFEEHNLQVAVSKLPDWRYEALVGIHEAIEAILCDYREILEDEVTNFDIRFEESRAKGNTGEPGNDKNAPYRKEHKFATKVEKLLAKELGVDWKRYDDIVNSL